MKVIYYPLFQGFINIDNIQGNYHILGKLNDDLLGNRDFL